MPIPNPGAAGPVDTTPPVVIIATTGGLVRKAAQAISGTGEAGTTVELRDGATLLGTAVVAANGRWNLKVTLGAEGTHRLVARDTDAAGNVGTSSAMLFTLDTVAPSVAIRAGGGLVRSATQLLSGSGEAGTLVQVMEAGVSLGSATVAANGRWSVAVTLAGEGVHRLAARDTDAAGNAGFSAPVLFRLDSVAPAIALTSAGGLVAQAAQTLSGTGEAGAVVRLWDGAQPLGQTIVGAGGLWSLGVTLVGQGAHLLAATATDAAGNIGTSAAALFTLDTVAPVVAISGAARTVLKASQVIAGTGEANTTLALYDGATLLGTTLVDAGGRWSMPVVLAGTGTHRLTARDTDPAGNIGSSAELRLSLALPTGNWLLMVDAPVVLADADFAGLGGLTWLFLSAAGHAALSLGRLAAAAFGNHVGLQAGPGVTALLLDASGLPPGASLVVYGSSGGDSIAGGPGSTWLHGGGGADTLVGGAGNDVFDYNAAGQFLGTAQHIDGGGGVNQLTMGFSGTIDDSAFAGIRNIQTVWLYGNGATALTLGHQASLAFGGKVVVTSAPSVHTVMVNGAGLDRLASLAAQGGGGNDSFTGGPGDDTLTGGSGNDVFDLSLGGHDSVADFDVGHDVLKLYGLGLARFADLGGRLSYAGGNAFLNLDATHAVVLANVAPGSLGAANFRFTQADPPPTPPAVNLNILLRGQSNAVFFDSFGGLEAMRHKVEALLGFDGKTSTVTLIADAGTATGANTMNMGTAFLTDWLKPVAGDWHQGWQVNTLEQGLLADIASLPAATRAAPTAVVWLHNEYDSAQPGLTAEAWQSAVRFDAGLVRQALGQGAATTPYFFVNAIPFQGADADSNQQIRLGMQALAQEATFNATVAAQFLDVNMDGFGAPGGAHMGAADALVLADRLARGVAEGLAGYALPGSPLALSHGQLDAAGPQAVKAEAVAGHANQVLLTVGFDHATSLKPLDSVAASGADWFVNTGVAMAGGQWATAAQLVDASHLKLSFAAAVPANALVFYGPGYGRVVAPDGTGLGHGIYDDQGLPLWTSAAGVQLGAPAQPLLADLPWH